MRWHAAARWQALAAALTAAGCRDGARDAPASDSTSGGGLTGAAGATPVTGATSGAGSAAPSGGSTSEGGGDAGVLGVATDTNDPFDAGDCVAPTPVADCTDGWCEIPAGCFVMGSPDDEWGHPSPQEDQATVTLTHAFLMQETEVTLDAWTAQGLPNPANGADGGGDCMGGDCPVANVSWFDAVAYANLLSERHEPALTACYELQGCTGSIGQAYFCQVETTGATAYDCDGFRLPTDAEWEYAARAGTTSAFYSGPITAYGSWIENYSTCRPDPNLEKIGWFCWNSGGTTHPVRGLSPNAFGLYDMAGNVGEWNNDRHDGVGATAPTDPDGKVDNHQWRNVRGGMFDAWSTLCRMASQSSASFETSYSDLGFRLVRNVTQ